MDKREKWRLNNLERWKEMRDRTTKAWRERNKRRDSKVSLARNRKNELKKINRVPAWANLEAIREFYINCPEGYEVDHIVPIRHPFVSGLHVLENLQYLPRSANHAKGNSFGATYGDFASLQPNASVKDSSPASGLDQSVLPPGIGSLSSR